eukprot:TRINITY_DN13027_c0_g1_i1.p1 TRINITY_DN13027_c0_g1~~TRINITY_DN13027_c0_g1_i1.p1  ORF type:complete len:254 (-),score=13.20 TRINITY_DN13027_c0_g1_i1:46-807(-)
MRPTRLWIHACGISDHSSLYVMHKMLVPSRQLIRKLSAKDRLELLKRLRSKDIISLWRIAAKFFTAKPSELASVVGAWSALDDFPSLDDPAPVTFYGKAALPISVPFVDRFDKLFTSIETEEDGEIMLGRVNVRKGALGNSLYPLYFETAVSDVLTVPATGEVALMALRYRGKASCRFDPSSLPGGSAIWPAIRDPLFPFDSTLVDFIRPVGPGVYVGAGWKYPPREPLGRRFLHFLLVRSQSDSSDLQTESD